MSSARQTFPVVGIGASAGGIPAMEGFFRGLESDCGMAFVIVTHLNPDHESLLHEVIGRYTNMPVKIAADGLEIEPSTVYVLPNNAILSVEDGRLRTRRPNPAHRERKPIDIFFSALAKDRGEHAVGIVLSGGDSDGTLGVKAIKEYGGLTLAQVPDSSGPRNPDMPQSAIASGLIDIAVPAEQMGEKLVQFVRSFDLPEGIVEADSKIGEKSADFRDEIYAILSARSGHDFSGYKTKTFLRRVKRRMQLAQLQSIEGYVELLKQDSAEVMSLFRDLLINVTNFFRDEDAFKALEEKVIPQLFEGRDANDTVRVWVPGCATGEEVYSIGILMREHMGTLSAVPRVQIFASDIDEHALAVARAARYPEALLEGVSTERRQRFFNNDSASYVVAKEVRELCIFSPHSVIRDPPFSRMDLVSCRNLLIYFGPEIQQRVIPTFHYSLKPGGYLLLGTSESISQHGDLFSAVDERHKIFRAREHGTRPRLPVLLGGSVASRFSGDVDGRGRSSAERSLRHAVETQVLERFAPAHVVINGDADVVYYSARTGRFIEAPQGAPSRQLMTMARRGLRLELRSALREAMETRTSVTRQNVSVEDDGDRVLSVNITIEPVSDRDNGDPLFLVLFEPAGLVENRSARAEPGSEDLDGTAALERELQGQSRAFAVNDRGIRDGVGRAEVVQRGTGLSQRGIAVHKRGT